MISCLRQWAYSKNRITVSTLLTIAVNIMAGNLVFDTLKFNFCPNEFRNVVRLKVQGKVLFGSSSNLNFEKYRVGFFLSDKLKMHVRWYSLLFLITHLKTRVYRRLYFDVSFKRDVMVTIIFWKWCLEIKPRPFWYYWVSKRISWSIITAS